MKNHSKLLTIAVLILAVVFTTACNDNKKRIEILKIDGIWVDKVPDDMVPGPDSMPTPKQCRRIGRKHTPNYILIPSHVPKNSDINIKLYGCWEDEREYIDFYYVFQGFKSNKTDNKIELTAYKKEVGESYFNDMTSNGITYFSIRDEYNITNDFEPGEIEFVVKNPDNEELKETITIE